MALLHGVPNELNYAGIRRVMFAVPSFHYKTILVYSLHTYNNLLEWIHANLTGRFYIGRDLALSNERGWITTIRVGFEKEEELMLFLLSCPELNK